MVVAHDVPLIDLEPYLDTNATKDVKLSIIDQVRRACTDYGFIQIKGHGVPVETQRGMLECCKVLFDLPQEEKDALSLKKNAQRRSDHL